MRARIASFTFVLFMVCSLAHGQDISAKITGTVTDASGAVVAGATVTARESSRGTLYPTRTNAAGVYYLSPLPVGQYVLTVTAPGFSSSQHPAISLDIAQTARIDVALTVGQASQTV